MVDISQMFYGCDSLKFIDISNFNLTNCDSNDDLFSNITSIKYINIYNITDNKIISKEFENVNDLFVCQLENIIINEKVYNCCDYDIEVDECQSFPETTIIDTETDIQDEIIPNKVRDTSLVLLGFSDFSEKNSAFSFNVYFVSLKNFIYSNSLSFPIEIVYKSLRNLESETLEVNCTKSGSHAQSKVKYECEQVAETTNIEQIRVNPEFNFGSQENITLAEISPLASMYLNNLEKLGGNLSNSTIYILNNSIVYNNGNNNYSISGEIKDFKSQYSNKNLTLLINPKSDKNTSVIQLNCTIFSASGNNYTVNCPSNGKNDYDFQNAISYIESDILLINVDYLTNSSSTGQEPEENEIAYHKLRNKSSTGLNGGAIAAIIIAPIIVVIALVAIILFTRKTTNVDIQNNLDGTNRNMNI